MRRGLMVALVAAMLLTACTAQADFYGSLRYAGTFNLKEFAFGMQSDAFGAEVALGYSKLTITDLENLDEDLEGLEPTASLMSLGGAAFFQIAGDERYGFDVGARAQYMTMSVEADFSDVDKADDETIKATLSCFAVGPVLRGRWFLVEDSIALGPEIYFKYAMWSSDFEAFGESGDGPGATVMELEYSLRMDFYF